MRPTLALLKKPPPRPPPPPPAPLGPAKIYTSRSFSPFLNLAYEDYLYRKEERDAPVLFMYRNEPCVIIGRNQVPWLETSPTLLESRGWPLVRRRSGGGAVFHDLGNTNYSILLPRGHFHRPSNAQLVLSAVHALGEPRATKNERNDIFVGPYKVSGCAYKIGGERAYHHGTMLLTTESAVLGEALKSRFGRSVMTRAVQSVPAPVRSLKELAKLTIEGQDPSHAGEKELEEKFSHDAFVERMKEAFVAKYGPPSEEVDVGEEEMEAIEEVRKGADELESWDWTYGQTAYFEVHGRLSMPGSKIRVLYKVYHGIITDVMFPPTEIVSEEEKRYGKRMIDERFPFHESMAWDQEAISRIVEPEDV